MKSWPSLPGRGRAGVRAVKQASVYAAVAAMVAGATAMQSPTAARDATASGAPAPWAAAAGRGASITVDGRRPGPRFDGVGAISGGGGNSRYLIDYPEPERSQILDYLFKPHYGASLQMLKLEIGGDSNSTDGSEPSIEHTRGVINCGAGYEWWVAEQAILRNPHIKLYGLQWSAPAWTSNGHGKLWSRADVHYVIDWLNCARSHRLTISYLGGRDEAGYNARWFEEMRAALDTHGYRKVKLVAADETGSHHWGVAQALARNKAFDAAVSVVGDHDACGSWQYFCATTATARSLHKPLWLAENPGLDPNTQASNEVRALNRMYVSGRMTAMFEWPLVDSMPAGLPHQGVGLITTGQPWTGSYTVNKMVWATAQTTQFVSPGWRYVRGADTLVGNSGSVDSYVAPNHSDWTMVAENTGSHLGQTIHSQKVSVKLTGGLSRSVVHVWATNLQSMNPADWFVPERDLTPAHGRFSYTIPPDYVVTFTSTSGQSKAAGAPPLAPAAAALSLPYSNTLNGNDGSDEPYLLAPLDGAFGPAPCVKLPPGDHGSGCLQQLTPAKPVLWHSKNLDYPYAVLGDASWANYTVSVKALITQPTGTAGVIGRFGDRASRNTAPVGNAIGCFQGYILDVAENGHWRLLLNRVTSRKPAVLAHGKLTKAFGVDTWHTLSLSMNGDAITASIDHIQLASVTDASYASGLVGIEAGAFTGRWPVDQYRDLSVKPLP